MCARQDGKDVWCYFLSELSIFVFQFHSLLVLFTREVTLYIHTLSYTRRVPVCGTSALTPYMQAVREGLAFPYLPAFLACSLAFTYLLVSSASVYRIWGLFLIYCLVYIILFSFAVFPCSTFLRFVREVLFNILTRYCTRRVLFYDVGASSRIRQGSARFACFSFPACSYCPPSCFSIPLFSTVFVYSIWGWFLCFGFCIYMSS